MLHTRSASRGVAIFFLVFTLALSVSAQNNSAHSKAGMNAGVREKGAASGTTVHAIVASGRLEMLRWPNFSDYRLQLETLYQRSGYAPVWLHRGHPTPQALEMISILQQSDSKGLVAEDYDSAGWPERLTHLQAQHTSSDEARFDVALTVCTMRYVSDLRIGRINPRHFEFGRDIGPKELDLTSIVESRLVKGTDLKSALANIEPTFTVYRELQEALVKYMLFAKEDDGERLPTPHALVLFGTQYEGVPRLARLLRLVGDLPESAEVAKDSRIYEGPLVDAVKRFQKRHGIRPDGYVTPETLDQLNVPLSERVEQIRLALERYRWLCYDFPQPPIVINIPGFRLYAFNEEGKVGLTMTVDVGGEYTPTPVLEDKIEYLVFRPYWDVPLDIQRDVIVANIKDGSDNFSANHLEAVGADGKVVTEGPISDQILEQIISGKLHVRQKPGTDNALGLVKFIFPNKYSVTLHDVPQRKDDFADFTERAFSHGCIHLKEPAKLAAWVLRDKPEWTLERVQREMQSGQDNLRVNLTKPLPVLIVYMTASVRENGDVYFYHDIYGYDAELQDALTKGYPYPR
jgi:murein L,D-transpeptidase YcbB/YkuD